MKYTPPPGHGHKLCRIQRLIHQKCSKRMSATPDSPKVPKLKSSTPDAQTNTNPTQIRNRHLMHQKSSLEGPPISSYSYMCIALCVGLPASLSLSLSLSLSRVQLQQRGTNTRLPIAPNPLWRIETQTLVSTDRSQPLSGSTAASPRPGSTEATEASPKQDRPKPTIVRLDRKHP
jgi:hypothetical protein